MAARADGLTSVNHALAAALLTADVAFVAATKRVSSRSTIALGFLRPSGGSIAAAKAAH